MPDFQLFRVKLYESPHLFDDLTRPQILMHVLGLSPVIEPRKGVIWHIGKLQALGPDAAYFRLGKTTTSTLEVFREGDFVEAEFESAPYTHVIVDSAQGVAAIARKPRLAPNAEGIARQLERLLNDADWTRSRHHEFEIDPLKDPEDFLKYLRSATAVTRFVVTFTRPNPLDIDEDITGPFQRWLGTANATDGKAEIEGDDLDATKLEAVARSAAATGNNATAVLSLEEEARPVKKSLRGGPVTVTHEDVSSQEEKLSLLERVRVVYRRIAGTNGNPT